MKGTGRAARRRAATNPARPSMSNANVEGSGTATVMERTYQYESQGKSSPESELTPGQRSKVIGELAIANGLTITVPSPSKDALPEFGERKPIPLLSAELS